MKDIETNPLFDELNYYMDAVKEEYQLWFPDHAYWKNNELLLRLYEEKMDLQALDILIKYNRFLYDILK